VRVSGALSNLGKTPPGKFVKNSDTYNGIENASNPYGD